MDLRIGRVHELTGDDGIGDLLRQFIRFGDRSLHPFGTFGEDEFRTVRLDEFAAFDGHGLWHHDDDPVSPCGRDGCQCYPRVAGRGLDQHGVLVYLAARLEVVDHGLGHTVLD